MNNTLNQENTHLNDTLVILKKTYKLLKGDVKDIFKKYQKGIKKAAYSGDRSDDKIEDISVLNKMMESKGYLFKIDLKKRLVDQLKQPYFAKINFKPKDSSKIINAYIGKHPFRPDNEVYRIYDWRAPISSLFYNYPGPEKNVKYEFVVHNPYNIKEKFDQKIEGDLLVRRNIDIEYSEEEKRPVITGIYDISSKIDLVSKSINEKTGGVLEDIVETIQKVQNEIIRADKDIVAVIQGTAGSGKTTVAIHRISYLLYTYKDLKEKDILLLSSSKVLANYIEKTLPELEIFSLTRSTLEDYLLKNLNEKQLLNSKDIFTNRKDKNIKIKNSKDFINKLDIYIKEFEDNIIKRVEEIDNYNELNVKNILERTSKKPIFTRINRVTELLTERKDDLKIELSKGNITVEEKFDKHEDTLFDINYILEELNIENIYKEFLNEYYPELNEKDYSLFDVVILYYLTSKLIEIIPDHEKFRHIVVDEGQDLGELQYKVIKSLGFKAGYTILGDLNQIVEDKGNIKNWNNVEEIFNNTNNQYKFKYFNIETSYRNTIQITNLARKILQKFKDFNYLPKPFHREGAIPKIKNFSSRKEILEKIVKEIKEIRKKGDLKAIGIIETDDNKMKNTYKFLKKQKLSIKFINEEFSDFTGKDIFLVNEELVKGLEFDTVFIIDPNESIYLSNKPLSAKRLFVLVTRAINNLYIYSINKTNSLLQ